VRDPHLFWLDDDCLFWFGGRLIFEFILPGGPLLRKLVGKVICLTIWIQWHNHVDRVTIFLWRFHLCPKFIRRLTSAHFDRIIRSVEHGGFGGAATSPKCRARRPFCVMSFCTPLLHFRVVFSVHYLQCWDITHEYLIIGFSKLPYSQFFANGLACNCWLPPANNVLAKGKSGLHSDTMWYDKEYVACHIGQISVHSVRLLLVAPPVSYIQYPKCIATLHWGGVAIIVIWINLHPVLCCFRQWNQMEPGGSQ